VCISLRACAAFFHVSTRGTMNEGLVLRALAQGSAVLDFPAR
jgi:hypothetical protein